MKWLSTIIQKLRFALPMVMLFCSVAGMMAQTKVAFRRGKYNLYRVYLADKNKSNFNLQAPERFLSAKALERRAGQSIFVDSTDLPVSPYYLQAIARKGYPVVCKSKWQNTVLIRTKEEISKAVFSDCPFVTEVKKVYSSPDSVLKAVGYSDYRRNVLPVNIVENSAYGAAKEQIENLNGAFLHSKGFKGVGKLIAVLDAGFANVNHINAFEAVKIQGVRNFVYGYKDDDVYSISDHGTKVLSAMALNERNIFVGTAPEADYLLLRTEDSETESSAEEDYWVAAAEYADSLGVDVISSSLGYHRFDDATLNYRYSDLDGNTSFISKSASMLAHKGIILVNSAGNDGMGQWKKINVPADAFDILTIGAISSDGINAAFSSIGPTADGRIKPDVMAFGCPASVVSGHGKIVPDVGTSFATPIIAGLVACLWQSLPNKSALEIMDLVRKSGSNAAFPDNIYGYGIPDFGKIYRQNAK